MKLYHSSQSLARSLQRSCWTELNLIYWSRGRSSRAILRKSQQYTASWHSRVLIERQRNSVDHFMEPTMTFERRLTRGIGGRPGSGNLCVSVRFPRRFLSWYGHSILVLRAPSGRAGTQPSFFRRNGIKTRLSCALPVQCLYELVFGSHDWLRAPGGIVWYGKIYRSGLCRWCIHLCREHAVLSRVP